VAAELDAVCAAPFERGRVTFAFSTAATRRRQAVDGPEAAQSRARRWRGGRRDAFAAQAEGETRETVVPRALPQARLPVARSRPAGGELRLRVRAAIVAI
jgi:hypothetical protein